MNSNKHNPEINVHYQRRPLSRHFVKSKIHNIWSAEDFLFIVGDNCSVNAKLSSSMNTLLIGCESHRLNLVIMKFVREYEAFILKVDNLMKKLQIVDYSAS
jgi:hypothetical protein